MNQPKICLECKWCIFPEGTPTGVLPSGASVDFFPSAARCSRQWVNLFNGKPIDWGHNPHCHQMRRNECGASGEGWEPREKPEVQADEWFPSDQYDA